LRIGRKEIFLFKGFPISLTETQLREICQEYGNITSVKILKTENIIWQNNVTKQEFISKGCGFVCFATSESSIAAFNGLKNKKIEDKTLFVHFWKPREELARDLNIYKNEKNASTNASVRNGFSSSNAKTQSSWSWKISKRRAWLNSSSKAFRTS
jgi:RNA-binding proteins (RRM domain)